MYEKNPQKIEMNSMDIIEEYMGDTDFTEDQKIVAKRMIHTTGDVEYRHIIDMSDNFIDEAKKALKKGVKIYTDTNMGYQGINKKALAKSSCELMSFISDE